jgi:hypothetical protein
MSNFGKNACIIKQDKLFTHKHYTIFKKLGIKREENLYLHMLNSKVEAYINLKEWRGEKHERKLKKIVKILGTRIMRGV